MSARGRIAVLATLLFLIVGCGGSTGPSTAPSPTTTPTSASTPVHLYFLHNEKVVPVYREVAVTSGAVATATMRALLSGPTAAEQAAGVSTTIPAGTTLGGISLHKGVALVDLSSAYGSGGGSLSMTARVMQVVFTLTQFSTVRSVSFSIDGKPITVLGGEGVMLDHPQTRADFESFLPPIFIDSPAMGQTVSSPLTVHGLANVFEGQFMVEVTDANGHVLARSPAHAAMGKFADFTTSMRFTVATAGTGRVTGFDRSAKDGSRINDYVVPVSLEP